MTMLRPLSSILLLPLLVACGGSDGTVQPRLENVFTIERHPIADTAALFGEIGLATSDYTGTLYRRLDAPSSAVPAAHLRGRSVGPNEPSEMVVLATDAAGTLDYRLPTVRAVASLPYLPGLHAAVGTPLGRHYIRGVNLIYPLYRLNEAGEIVDSITGQPTADDLDIHYGQFMPADSLAWYAYLSRLRIITGIASAADSVLLINHGTYSGHAPQPARVVHRTLDVLIHSKRIITGAPSPGEILASGRNSTFFLERDSAHRPVAIVEYRWRH